MVDDARRPNEEVQDENPVVAHRISLQANATELPFFCVVHVDNARFSVE
jgi:hypothetical protein